MEIQQAGWRRAITVAGLLCLSLAVVSGSVVAVSALSVTSLTNAEVEAGQTSTHTLEYQADEISADGATDVLYVQLPNTYAGNLSFSTVEFTNRTSGAAVSISSSTSVVDGPDGDGVRETLRTGISNDADYRTDDIRAVYEFSLTHPPVEETTSYDVTIIAQDSSTESARTTATDAITVTAGDTATATPGETNTATATATPTGDAEPTATATPMPTEMDTDESTPTEGSMATETPTETSGSGPGFGVVTGAIALAASFLLFRD